jgi:hypothetical protein
MQIKTIQKTISSKMEEWLKTITDESLRKDVRKNLLVSGGSITSMLLNEKINDFDIYINDMDVLMRLVQYYILPVPGTVLLDGRKKADLIDKLEKKYGWLMDAGEEIYSAYSISLNNLKEDQIKLFFETEKGGMRLNEDKKPEELNYSAVFFSPNAISLSNNVQIVCRFHGDNEAIHKTFDFIHATNFFTFETGLVTNKEALESILTKQLKYQGSLYPLTSIIRMKKFIKREWNINAGEILKIMFQISELDLKNPDVLEDQLIGVDVAYFSKLIEILRGLKDVTLTSKYLNTIIDRVFNEADDSLEEI